MVRIAFVPLLILALSCAGLGDRAPADAPTPAQAVTFSHKVHAEQAIGCVSCHQYKASSRTFAIPSVQLCMVCHWALGPETGEIQKVRAYFSRKEEIPWRRNYGFAAFANVYWDHQPHVTAATNCSACHGEVAQMAAGTVAVAYTMRWCMDCHESRRTEFDRPERAANCFTCHR